MSNEILMWQIAARFKQHKVKQPVEGPGHSNVAVPGGKVMSTEMSMKVGSQDVQKYLLVQYCLTTCNPVGEGFPF